MSRIIDMLTESRPPGEGQQLAKDSSQRATGLYDRPKKVDVERRGAAFDLSPGHLLTSLDKAASDETGIDRMTITDDAT